MNGDIKIREWKLDNNNPSKIITPTDRNSLPYYNENFAVEMLEIETDNPSDIILCNTNESNGGKAETALFLYRLRDKMTYHNGKYIVRLNFDILNVNTSQNTFEIKHDKNQEFKATAYLTPLSDMK